MADFTIEPPEQPQANQYTIEPPPTSSEFTIEPPKKSASVYTVEPPSSQFTIDQPSEYEQARQAGRTENERTSYPDDPWKQARKRLSLSHIKRMNTIFTPVDVTTNKYLGRPVEQATGIPAPITDFLATVALPGGIFKSAEEGLDAWRAGETFGPAALKAAKAFVPGMGESIKDVAQMPFKAARNIKKFVQDVPKNLGFQATPEAVEAAADLNTEKSSAKTLEQNLFVLKKQKEADYLRVMKEGQATPEEIKALQNQRALYIKQESAKGGGDIFDEERYVDPATQHWYDTRLDRYVKEAEDDYKYLVSNGFKKGDLVKPDTYDEVQNYVHKIVKGLGHAFDEAAGVARVRLKSLSRTASAMKARTMLALQRDDGARRVIAAGKNGKGFSIFENKLPVPIERAKNLDFKKGDIWTDDNGRVWKFTDATTEEIKAETSLDYHQNLLATVMSNWLDLKSARRNAEFLENTKKSLIEKELMTTDRSKAPTDWTTTKLAQFGGYWMPKRIAEVLDDFSNVDSVNGIEAINQFIVGAMLLNPVPHTENMLALWMNARGWENFTPKGYFNLLKTIAPSINDVYAKSDLYVEVLKKGGYLQYPKQVIGDWVKTLFPKALEAAKTDMGWHDIAITTGMKIPKFFEAIGDALHKTVWFGSDVMYMQLIRELKNNGMTTDEAMKVVNQVMVSYQMPARIMDSRLLSETLNTPLFVFPRWMYGLAKSLASQVSRSLSNDPVEMERAVGQLFSLAFMTAVIKPVADHALQQATGNAYAQWRAFGPEKYPLAVKDFINQAKNKDYRDLIYTIFEISPVAEMFIQIFGKYMGAYPIIEPDDFFAALQGDPKALENVVLQFGDAGINITQPLELIKSISTGFEGFWQGMAEELGAQLPSEERIQRREQRKEQQERGEAQRNFKRRDTYGLPQ